MHALLKTKSERGFALLSTLLALSIIALLYTTSFSLLKRPNYVFSVQVNLNDFANETQSFVAQAKPSIAQAIRDKTLNSQSSLKLFLSSPLETDTKLHFELFALNSKLNLLQSDQRLVQKYLDHFSVPTRVIANFLTQREMMQDKAYFVISFYQTKEMWINARFDKRGRKLGLENLQPLLSSILFSNLTAENENLKRFNSEVEAKAFQVRILKDPLVQNPE